MGTQSQTSLNFGDQDQLSHRHSKQKTQVFANQTLGANESSDEEPKFKRDDANLK